MDVTAVLKRSVRYAWTAIAFLVIAYALLVLTGRQLLPQLEQRQADINQFFSAQLGISLSTEHLDGSWTRLTPKLVARGLKIAGKNPSATPAITISHIESEFSIVRSLLNTELIWRDLSIGQVALDLREDAYGNWFIADIPITNRDKNPENNGPLDTLLSIALLSNHIGIEQLKINITFFSGANTTLYVDEIRMENAGDFHRARARLSIDQIKDGAELLIEGHGDPKDWESFDGQAYVHLKQINFRGPLNLILRDWLPPAMDKIADTNTELNAEFWLKSLQQGRFDLRGTIHADEIPLSWAADLPPIKNLDATVSGWLTTGDSWGLQWQDLRFDWNNTVIAPLNLEFKQGLGIRWNEVSLSSDHLNIETLKQGLIETGLGGDKTTELLQTLNPSGQLQNLHLSLDLNKAQPITGFSTYINQLTIDSWHHTPAARRLSGYLNWQDNKGFFDFDSPQGFAMLYPGAYDTFMQYGSTLGRVNLHWLENEQRLQIAGGPIDISGEEGQIRAYISLDIPTNGDGRDEDMFLQVGIKNSHSRFRTRYIPSLLDSDLLSWMDRAIGNIDIVEAGFIWRGSLKADHHHKRSVQFYGEMANGEVTYDPDWPTLTDMSGIITVDGPILRGVIGPAKLGQAQLKQAIIATHPGALLSVDADIITPVNTAVDTLLSSPLASRVAALKDWDVQGSAKTRLELMIPLSKNHQGQSYSVQAKISAGSLQHRDFKPLFFSQLSGEIAYNNEEGLHSRGIQGNLWGQALQASITSAEGITQIDSEGLINLSKAPAWHPLLATKITGTTHYIAKFTGPGEKGPAKLRLLSDLQGIAIDLPPPAYKTAAQSWPMITTLTFRDTGLLVTTDTTDINALLRINGQHLDRGIIAIGGKEQPSEVDLADLNGLLITGQTPIFNLDHWLAALKPDSTNARLRNEQQPSPNSFDSSFTVKIDTLSAAGFELSEANVEARHNQREWDLWIDSPKLAGNIRVPLEPNQALVARLNYIALPKPNLNSEQSFLADLDPSTLPALDFATEGLRIGENELGSLAFVMKPQPQGVDIEQIRAEITGITIDDRPGGELASLSWRVKEGQHQSHFSAALLSDDIGAVLKAWDMPMLLNSHNAAFLADLNWQGKPWDVSADSLSGHVALNFKEGYFFQAPGNTTNALLKVVGLINFDTWLRRLQFDFSDLFSSGVNYDQLQGGLAFEQGKMAFDEPIVVSLSSGKLRLLGNTNLIEETIDARLIATLPIGTNLPWMAALVGGLPAAAGVYITSKLFAKQVNRISSLSYKIRGSWDHPDIEVDRIFSDETP